MPPPQNYACDDCNVTLKLFPVEEMLPAPYKIYICERLSDANICKRRLKSSDVSPALLRSRTQVGFLIPLKIPAEYGCPMPKTAGKCIDKIPAGRELFHPIT